MWKALENIVSMFVYAAAYMLIVLVSIKIVGASLSPNFEKKIGEEGNIGLAIVFASVFVSLAILLSSVVH
jgi:hypothetical protein